MDQYRARGGHDRESYQSFYDAGPVKIDRKNAKPPVVFVPRAFVCVTGMIQPGILARQLGPAEYDSGLAARFLLAAPPPMVATWTGDSISDAVRNGWRDSLHTMLTHQLPESPTLVPLSDVAMRLWAAAHDRMDAARHVELDNRLRAARAKLIGAIPRIALIFQLTSATSGEGFTIVRAIDDLAMKRAIEVVEWCAHETRRVYALLAVEIEGDGDAAILRRIEAAGGTCTARDLMHWSRRFRSSAKMAGNYLDSLVSDGMGRWECVATGGHPSKVFILQAADGGNGNENPRSEAKNRACVTVTTPRQTKDDEPDLSMAGPPETAESRAATAKQECLRQTEGSGR
jgi:Protein of unknown function (DUF3987)